MCDNSTATQTSLESGSESTRNDTTRDHKPLIKQAVIENKVNVYVSSAQGKRFEFSRIDFNEPTTELLHDAQVSLSIDLSTKNQKIDGFGGAFTDATSENLMKLPQNLQQQIVDDYFHQENGLVYTLGRTHIGGSDFSSRVYTLDDHEYDYELRKFALTEEDTKGKIPFIKMAMKHVPNIKIISTSWSPPVWLKTNKKINHRGGIVGEVTGESNQTYANYFVKYLDAYKREGINMYGISPANESTNGRYIPFFPLNGVGFSQMRDFIVKTLGPTLHRAGYGKDKLKLFILDDQRLHMKSWVNIIMSHPNVTHIAFHWYFNNVASPKILDTMKNKYPDLDIWSTEGCSGSYAVFSRHVEIGSWARAEAYAKDITEDFNHNTNAWIDWNLLLDPQGGPNFVDAPIIVDIEKQKYTRQPMYYALAHFSKFIKPNSMNWQHNLSVNGKFSWFTWFGTLYATTFRTPDNNIVVVVTNTYKSDIKLSISLSNNADQVIVHTVPKKSITTFVWKL